MKELLKKKEVRIALLAIVILIVVVLSVVVIRQRLSGAAQDRKKNQQLIDDANAEVDISLVTLTDAQINTIVSKLKSAFYSGMFGWVEDEDAIYSAFEGIGSRSDLLLVHERFGVYKNKTLPDHIHSLLDESEVSRINSILAAKNINYLY